MIGMEDIHDLAEQRIAEVLGINFGPNQLRAQLLLPRDRFWLHLELHQCHMAVPIDDMQTGPSGRSVGVKRLKDQPSLGTSTTGKGIGYTKQI